MKRQPLKRNKPLKRTRIKRKFTRIRKRRKKSPLTKLKEQLWELCKQYCRKKWGNTCYTCGKQHLEGSDWQTGHAIPSVLCPFELDYHPDNLRPQDYHCNINCGGNGAVFIEKLRREHGQGYVDNLFLMKNQPRITKPTLSDVEEYIEKYKKLLQELK